MSWKRIVVIAVLLACLAGGAFGLNELYRRVMQGQTLVLDNVDLTVRHPLPCFQVSKDIFSPWEGAGFSEQLLEVLRNRLKPLPGVRHAAVEYRWPAQILADVELHQVDFTLNSYQVVTGEGEVLSSERHWLCHTGLRIQGDPAQAAWLRQKVRQFQGLSDQHQLAGLTLDPVIGYLVYFEDGVEVRLGWKDLPDRFRRGLQVYRHYREQKQLLPEYLDVRYSGGVAVQEQQ